MKRIYISFLKGICSLSKHKIVIVGGGFGGIRTAIELSYDARFDVTLISDHPDFRYYPALFRTATGDKKRISSIPLKELFEDKRVDIVNDRMISLDKKRRVAKTESGLSVPYDAIILALGVKTNYFNIKGLAEYSYGIKTVADAERLKAHLHNQLITALP